MQYGRYQYNIEADSALSKDVLVTRFAAVIERLDGNLGAEIHKKPKLISWPSFQNEMF